MKSFYAVAASMFFANGVIQMAAGLKCYSGCAACWLDNNNDGVDTKFTCNGDKGMYCSDVCPSGYNGIHCAEMRRCLWAEKVAQKTNNISPGFQIGVVYLMILVVMPLARVIALPTLRMATYIAERSMQMEHVRPPETGRTSSLLGLCQINSFFALSVGIYLFFYMRCWE